ncbi:MAG: hypothetical protein H6646_08430 [Anaerolineales bacterium]|nr:hypothetical protein [Anaerolineales bacterium]
MPDVTDGRLPHISTVIGNAILFEPKPVWELPMDFASLVNDVSRLFALLEAREVDYVLVGGIAMLSYVEGRNTEDINLIVSLSSLEKLPEIVITAQDADWPRGQFRDLRIDFLLTSNRLFDRVCQRFSTEREFVERAIPTATVEGLLLLKLYALPSLYRQGNFARVGLYENDIATLLQAYRPPVEPLLNELTQHLSNSDMRELRAILHDIERRVQRFDQQDR